MVKERENLGVVALEKKVTRDNTKSDGIGSLDETSKTSSSFSVAHGGLDGAHKQVVALSLDIFREESIADTVGLDWVTGWGSGAVSLEILWAVESGEGVQAGLLVDLLDQIGLSLATGQGYTLGATI
tara:strand:- start:147 stop:527 length:381 start_codon:yes stop_codon:yes gene_type:complete